MRVRTLAQFVIDAAPRIREAFATDGVFERGGVLVRVRKTRRHNIGSGQPLGERP